MTGFLEKTVAEAGFAASWAQHVAPLAARIDARKRRQMLFASLVTGLAVGGVVSAVMLNRSVAADSIMANPLYVSLVLALAALAAIASWVSVMHRDFRLADAVDLAVETHFAALFAADGNEAFAEVILQDLVADGVLDEAAHAIITNHAGTYRGCRIRLLTARSQLRGGRFSWRNGRRSNLVVARISLPHDIDGHIRIDSQRDRLPGRSNSGNSSSGNSRSGRSNAGNSSSGNSNDMKINHDQFGHIFGVACSNWTSAARLLTPHFAENLLLIQQRLANPLGGKASDQVRVAMQMEKGNLLLVIEQPVRDHDPGRLDPRRAEMLARALITRFAVIPGLVDELHGDSDTLPVSAALSHSGSQVADIAV